MGRATLTASRRRDTALAAMVYGALAVLLLHRTWAAPGSRVVGQGGDSQQIMWALRWVPFALHHHLNPLMTTYVGHGSIVNLAFNTSMPLAGLLLSPMTVLFGASTSYALLLTIAFGGTSWTSFLAIRRQASPVAAFVGGLAVGFSPYLSSQGLDHAHLTTVVLVPVFLMLVEDLAVTPRGPVRRVGVLLGVTAGAQMYLGEEVVPTALVAALVLLAVLAALRCTDVASRLRRTLTGSLIAAATGLVISTPLLAVQLFGANRISREPTSPGTVSTDLLGFVVPSPRTVWASTDATGRVTSDFLPNPVEHGEYVGIALLVVVLVTVIVRRRSTTVMAAGLTALVMGLLSLGPTLHVRGHDTGLDLPERVLARLPIDEQVLPSRLTIFMFLGIGFVVAAAVDGLRAVPRPALRVAGLSAVAGSLVILAPVEPYPATGYAVPQFFTHDVRTLPQGAVALVLPWPSPYAAEGMLWQQTADFRFQMPGGYWYWPDGRNNVHFAVQETSATATLFLGILAGKPEPLTPGLRAAVTTELHEWHVDVVLLGPMNHEDVAHSTLVDLLGSDPDVSGGVERWSVPTSL